MRRELLVETPGGDFAGIDFGGAGTEVLLTHEVGLNAESWAACAEILSQRCHPVAVDMRGHARTTAEPDSVDQPWADVGALCEVLQMPHPVIVGEGVGGWHVAAATITGAVSPSGLGMVGAGALFVGDRAKTMEVLRAVSGDDMLDLFAERFGIGWEGDDAAWEAYLLDAEGFEARDWFAARAAPGSWRRVLERGVVPGPAGWWRRRPTRAAMRVLTDIDAQPEPLPCSDSYAGLTLPMLFVDGAESLMPLDEEDLRQLVLAGPRRRAVTAPGAGLITLESPALLADAIGLLVDEVEAGVRG